METSTTFCIGIKDLASSVDALEILLYTLYKIGNKIIPFHIYLESNDSALKSEIEVLFSSNIPMCKFRITWQRQKKQFIQYDIIEFVRFCECEYLVTGFSQNDKSMGYILIKSPCSVIFVKSSVRRNSPLNWLVCVDASQKAYKAFKITFELMRESDIVSVVYIEEGSEIVQKRYGETNDKYRFFSIPKNSEERVYSKILEFFNDENGFEFIVCGSIGESAEISSNQEVGTTVKNILKNCPSNVIVIK